VYKHADAALADFGESRERGRGMKGIGMLAKHGGVRRVLIQGM